MKKWLMLLLLAGCRETEMPGGGVYVRTYSDAYTLSHDTLMITPAGNGLYQVEKRSGFRKRLDGKDLAPTYRVRQFEGKWREGAIELAPGKHIRFEGEEVFLGKEPYKKLKR